MIRKILVPTDGSDHAAKALDLAADLAGKYGAGIVILHVLLRDASPAEMKALAGRKLPKATADELDRLTELPLESEALTGAYAPIHAFVPEEVQEEVGRVIAENARAAAAAKGVSDVSVRMTAGDAAKQIVAAAEKEGADMIVMGSRGFGDLKGLLLGSVSHKVSNHALCTCVTVK
ncbi:MAG: universal stress protein [Alphaproteobacteria bacterium]|nr:universal stress protein [Alphaproteobacteria bacterium]